MRHLKALSLAPGYVPVRSGSCRTLCNASHVSAVKGGLRLPVTALETALWPTAFANPANKPRESEWDHKKPEP